MIVKEIEGSGKGRRGREERVLEGRGGEEKVGGRQRDQSEALSRGERNAQAIDRFTVPLPLRENLRETLASETNEITSPRSFNREQRARNALALIWTESGQQDL